MTFRVGVPKAESDLTDAAQNSLALLLRPGPGRSVYTVPEAPFPNGRPDLVLIAISPAAVRARMARGLRLSNFTEAKVLAAVLDDSLAPGVTPEHARAVERRLESRGWLDPSYSQLDYVSDSLIVEAKQAEWRRGLRQLIRNRRYAHRAALLVPASIARLVDETALNRLQCGLLSFGDDVLAWRQDSLMTTPSHAGILWLTELALRRESDEL